ncbi:ABC transporter ATP-binding protein [Ureibacillus acetophenoni]|uniref:Multiple sugar transport system ATP-binding protein n=1 Tax=Ureibacillus acetophenoni TaxID=614649 RepID=A0A285UV62_9BACL|nr:ABC transporter ATP-binding protein [Ureibacillus acetophenoni]SOC44606.1 multiple sugar transport system ATP-binding protein [Ureibacillus acetophenoni]
MEIKLTNLAMDFQQTKAVNDLTITIQDGHLVSILGPSGCGKSTTLNMLAGLYKPTAGEIYFGDKLVNQVEPEHREIGMVFQNYALYPHLTVLKNIMFPLKMAKVNKKEAFERATEMAKLVQIDHLLDRKPGQLSGGQQQRVAIARALVKNPKVLLLDEPLSNLDARLRLEMREEIRRIQKEVGITTIFVTHDQEEAMSISDKILLMRDGTLQQYTTPLEMYDKPSNLFVSQFMGNPPINIYKATVNKELKRVELKNSNVHIPLLGNVDVTKFPEDVIVGIRPESFVSETSSKELPQVSISINLIERTGRDTLLSGKIGEQQVRALISSKQQLGNVEELSLYITEFTVFDSETENSIWYFDGEGAQ